LSGIVDESDIVEESDAVAALIERELSVGSSFDSNRADGADDDNDICTEGCIDGAADGVMRTVVLRDSADDDKALL